MLVVCNVYRAQQSNEELMLQLSVFSLMYSIDNVQASLTSRSLLLFPKVGGGGGRGAGASHQQCIYTHHHKCRRDTGDWKKKHTT